MKSVVLAPDSFKGSLSAQEVALALQEGIRRVWPDIETVMLPVSDGGEGFLENMKVASQGEMVELEASDPLGRRIKTGYLLMHEGQTALIEMARVSGLTLIDEQERNPLYTSTYGTGELIRDALDRGVRELVIGIGGSATNDGGLGMAMALGVRFFDSAGKELGLGGKELNRLAKVDMSGLHTGINESKITVACDVDNPLYGPNGAAYVYGPQKGATKEIVRELDQGLMILADVIKRDLARDVADLPGAGAAGGLGAGLMAFLNAELKSGISVVLEALRAEEVFSRASLIVTGEGRIDGQTLHGKVPIGVARAAKKYGKPVIAVAGGLGDNLEPLYMEGIDGLMSIVSEPMSLDEAMQKARVLVADAAERVARLLLVGRYLS